MSRPAITYDPQEATLVVKGFGPLLTEGSGSFVAPVSVVEGLTLTELRHALRAWAEDYRHDDPRLDVSDDSPEHFGEHSMVRSTDVGLEAGKLVIRARSFSSDRPPANDDLLTPLRSLLRRRRATVTRVEVDEMPGYWTVVVTCHVRRVVCPGSTLTHPPPP